MKTILTFAITLIALCSSVPSMAQSQSATGSISGNVNDSQGPPLYINICKGSNVHQAPSIEAVLHFESDEDMNTVENLRLAASSYEPTVEEGRIQSKSEMARYTVHGHPKGSFDLVFTAADDGATATEGRQKNRRVEIKIIFN